MKRIFVTSLILLSLTVFSTAQTAVVPIFSLSPQKAEDGTSYINYGNLLGGVENGKFLNAKTTFEKLKGGEKFSLFDISNASKDAFSLGEIKPGDDVCSETYYVSPEINASADWAIGANADWKIVPRQPKEASLTDANYKKAVAEILKLKGLAKSPAKIKQAFRVDLDGDGREEVLILANSVIIGKNLDTKPGSYSFLLVGKIVGGKVRNLLVGGSFLKTANDYFDGEYSLSGIADLNGDGTMEFIVDVSGYEENWTHVYEMKAGKPSEIKALYYYCGV